MKAIKSMLLISILAATLFLFNSVVPVKAHKPRHTWAALVSGFVYETVDDEFDKLRSILTTWYGFDDTNLFYRLWAPKQGLKDAITWLSDHSDYGDQVFLYIGTHGGGWDSEENCLHRGRIDPDGDEGPELYNATSGQWYGVDECLYFEGDDGIYWDDELASDLSSVKCGTMIAVIFGCKFENSTEGCYTGGFIDDLSGYRRIIISPTNETRPAYYDSLWGYGFFSRPFIDCLNPCYQPFHDADSNGDGAVSINEAFWYAWENDLYRQGGDESPWMDDDGNGLPTFKNGIDNLDAMNGWFSHNTWLNVSMYPRTGDLGGGTPPIWFQYDGVIDGKDKALFLQCYAGAAPPEAKYLCDLGGGTPPQFFKYDGVVDGKDKALFMLCYRGLGPD